MRLVRARAHASLANLGHGFDVFGLCVDAGFDEVELSRSGRGVTLVVEGDGARRLPTSIERNTAGLALTRLWRDHPQAGPVRIRIRKGVPGGGGLGSSAASAAAAVTAANRLFALGLSRHQLVAYAAHGERAAAGAAHADNVAASLFGGFVVVEKDDPARVLCVRPPKHLRIAVAQPRLSLTTAAARRALPRRVAVETYSQGCARAAQFAAAMAAGDVRAMGEALEGSFSDRARSRLIPGFADVCASARRAGAAGATVSGAGPSVLALVDATRVHPQEVAEAMRSAFRRAGLDSEVLVTRPAGRARVVEESR